MARYIIICEMKFKMRWELIKIKNIVQLLINYRAYGGKIFSLLLLRCSFLYYKNDDDDTVCSCNPSTYLNYIRYLYKIQCELNISYLNLYHVIVLRKIIINWKTLSNRIFYKKKQKFGKIHPHPILNLTIQILYVLFTSSINSNFSCMGWDVCIFHHFV